MKNLFKKTILLVILGFAFVAPNTTLALEATYTPLVALPGVTASEDGLVKAITMAEYLAGAMKFIIAFAGLLAFVMLVYSGTKYIAAGVAPSAKANAKEGITQALIGLAIVLTAYLVLNTINPNLVNFKLTLEEIKARNTAKADVTASTRKSPDLTGEKWPFTDTARRTELESKGITVNRNNCETIGQGKFGFGHGAPCTSLGGLQPSVITKLLELKKDCELVMKTKCLIQITGGTEYWLHGNGKTFMKDNPTFHKPVTEENPLGGLTLDLSINPEKVPDISKPGSVPFNEYIVRSGEVVSDRCINSKDRHYRVLGVMFVDESRTAANGTKGDRHWHVCFY